jgi:hypothetical protein
MIPLSARTNLNWQENDVQKWIVEATGKNVPTDSSKIITLKEFE